MYPSFGHFWYDVLALGLGFFEFDLFVVDEAFSTPDGVLVLTSSFSVWGVEVCRLFGDRCLWSEQ